MTVVVIQQTAAPQVVVSSPAAPVAVNIGIQGPRAVSTAVGPGFKLVGAEIRFDIASLTGL